MNNPPDKIVAFIADGEDSFMAITIGTRVFPAVTSASNEETIAAMEIAMTEIARKFGRTIRKYEFTERRELGVFTGTTQ